MADNLPQSDVTLMHPNGDIYSFPQEAVQDALDSGFKVPTSEQVTEAKNQSEFGNRPISAAALGAAKSMAPFGLGEAAITGSGLSTDQNLQQIEQRNRPAEIVGEVGGLFAPSPIGLGKIAGAVGKPVEAAVKYATGVGKESGIAAKILAGVASKGAGSAVEGGIYSASNKVDEAVIGDPNEAAESFLSDVGAGTLWGAGIGGALGGLGVAVPAGVTKAKSALNDTWESMGLGGPLDTLKDKAANAYATVSSAISGQSKEDILAAIANRHAEAAPLDTKEVVGNLQRHLDLVEDAKNTAIKDIRPAETSNLINAPRVLNPYKLSSVSPEIFNSAVDKALPLQPNIQQNVTRYSLEDLSKMRTYLSEDGSSGYAIKPDGELTSVFSSVRGRGPNIVNHAIANGANKLDAFEGHLTNLYGKQGFNEVKREKNWTLGEPDVVYMQTPSNKLLSNVDPDTVRNEFNNVYKKLDDTVNQMRSEPELYPASYARQLEQIRDGLVPKLNGEPSPADVFNTLNDLKRTIDTKIPYEKVPNAAASNAIGVIRDLRGAVKDSLEDQGIWGEGAARQAAFNDALSDYFKSANVKGQKGDFIKQFTYKTAGGQLKIDPGKVETFLKNSQTTKGIKSSEALSGFIKSSSNLLDQIEASYKSLPDQSFDKSEIKSLLEKNADVVMKNQHQAETNRVLSQLGRSKEDMLSPAVGGYLAHAAGLSHPVVGAVVTGLEALKNPIQTVQRLAKLETAMQNTFQKIARGAKALVKPSYNAVDYTKGFIGSKLAQMSTQKYDKVTSEIQEMSSNPVKLTDMMARNTSSLQPHAPNIVQAMQQTGSRALGFLASKIPQRPNQGPLAPKIEPSKAELAIFGRYYQYVEKPLTILKEAEAGALTHEGIEVLSQVYPALYSKIKTQITQELTANKREIPYTRKMMLSLLMGSDMDGTMTPQAIQSNQALLTVSGAQADAKDAALQGKPKTRAKGLDKLSISNRALTAQQASAQRTGKA